MAAFHSRSNYSNREKVENNSTEQCRRKGVRKAKEDNNKVNENKIGLKGTKQSRAI